MYGQMTAGSWIYIGTQGILQGTFETFAAVADKRFGGTLGRHDHADRRPGRHGRRAAARRHDERRRRDLRRVRRLPHPAPPRPPLPRRPGRLARGRRCRWRVAARDERPSAVDRLLGNAAEMVPALLEMARPIDIVTDQTSAHDPLATRRSACRSRSGQARRSADPAGFTKEAQASMAAHVRAMVEFQDRGAEFRLRQQSATRHARGATTAPSSSPGSCRLHPPALLRGQGPVPLGRAVRRPADIAATDRAILELFPENERLQVDHDGR